MHFIGNELRDAIENTRKLGRLLREINTTFLTLIPRKETTEELGDFRPISICIMVYKILSKALAEKLKRLLPKIISKEQTGLYPVDLSLMVSI